MSLSNIIRTGFFLSVIQAWSEKNSKFSSLDALKTGSVVTESMYRFFFLVGLGQGGGNEL